MIFSESVGSGAVISDYGKLSSNFISGSDSGTWAMFVHRTFAHENRPAAYVGAVKGLYP